MAITPPKERIWWHEPIERTELIWASVGFLWGLVMFFMMIYWHAVGQQNLSTEAYRVTPDAYAAKVQAFADANTVREEGDTGIPVVRPPPGSDVYMLARLWEWWPVLELERGKPYRLHLSSLDWQHGFSLQPVNINLQVHPGYEMVLTLTPTEAGEFSVVCNEFCGIGHHVMVGKIHVVDGLGG
ncbi:MAG: cytochrome C oxidase subunit II [Alphaproteobacteria bacterium]